MLHRPNIALPKHPQQFTVDGDDESVDSPIHK